MDPTSELHFSAISCKCFKQIVKKPISSECEWIGMKWTLLNVWHFIHIATVKFSFLLNWIFPQKSFFLSLNRSFPIESLETFSIVWNIDTLRHHIVFVNEKIASLFVPFFDSKRCRNMYNVHKFGLCGYFFIQPIHSLPTFCVFSRVSAQSTNNWTVIL